MDIEGYVRIGYANTGRSSQEGLEKVSGFHGGSACLTYRWIFMLLA
jgi:hypothetical protein